MIRFLQSGNRAAKYLIGIFLTMVCLSMVIYLIPGLMSDTEVSRSGVIASIGGQEILTQDVNRVTTQMQRQQRFPEQFIPYLRSQAVQHLLQEAEVSYEAQRMGLQVSDEEVRQEMHSPGLEETFFPGGKWIGQEQYEMLLQNAGYTPASWERELKITLLNRKLISAVTAGVDVPAAEIENTYKEQNTKVKFDYATFNVDDIQKQVNPTDAELKSYYDSNKATYENSIPEKRQVRYFVVSQQQAEKNATVTQSDLEKYYQDHADKYRVPDRVRVRHILVKTPAVLPGSKPDEKAIAEARKKAEDLVKQVRSGGNFAELAKKYSDDPGSKDAGGEIGWVTKDSTLVDEFKKASLALTKGQVSDPVQSTFGFHVIQAEDKETAHQKPLSEVKAEIEPVLKQQKLARELDNIASAAETEARTQSMEKAAARYGVQVVQSNPVAQSDSLPGVGPAPQLMSAIFSATDKSPATSTRTPQGVVVFQVQKIESPRTPSFDEIKDKVATAFKASRANILIAQKAQELKDRAHAGHDLNKAAKELGATVKSSDLVGRTGQVPDLGSMSGPASAAFALKKGEISEPINAGRVWAVLEITDRQEPNLTGDEFAKNKDNIREQLISQKQQQAQGLFLSNLHTRLEKEGKLKINKTEMDSLLKMKG
ncbi:MAG: peptidylprolyl isomerase [Candidatus Angelobacter sp. Gp1-AA117]|nr:MAG: peptidylprolyl isomerase [Candidatus Angelobacter sp. Gp1-AA117]